MLTFDQFFKRNLKKIRDREFVSCFIILYITKKLSIIFVIDFFSSIIKIIEIDYRFLK